MGAMAGQLSWDQAQRSPPVLGKSARGPALESYLQRDERYPTRGGGGPGRIRTQLLRLMRVASRIPAAIKASPKKT